MTWAKIVIAAILCIVLLVVAAFSLVMGRPLIDRASQLVRYFVFPLPEEPKYLESDLHSQILIKLSDGLSPREAERLYVHRVPTWFPMKMDDPKVRMEVLRQVADTVPAQTRDWLPLHSGVRDGYILLLSALAEEDRRRGVLLVETENSISKLRASRSTQIKKINPSRAGGAEHAKDSAAGWGVKIASFIAPSVDSKTLASATQAALLTLSPNPADDYSTAPPLDTPSTKDVDDWFAAPAPNSKQIASATVAIAVNDMAANQSGAIKAVADPKDSGEIEVKATLSARDWRIFQFRRNWLNANILEQFRTDWNLLINVSWLFASSGPLSEIPVAVVVGKDVLYEMSFQSIEDANRIKAALDAHQTLMLRIGSTTVAIPASSVSIDVTSRTVRIAPQETRASILAVVTRRY